MNKSLKLVATFGACAGVLLSVALAPFHAFADPEPETRDLTFSFEIKDGEERSHFNIRALGTEEVPGEHPEDPPTIREILLEPNQVGVRLTLLDSEVIDLENPEPDDHGNYGPFIEPSLSSGANNNLNDRLEATCSSNYHCTITVKDVTDDEGFRFMTPGGSPYTFHYADGRAYYGSAVNLTENTDFEIAFAEERVEFSGSAYVAWECEDGGVCLSLLEGLTVPEDTVNRTETTYDYISANDVVDARTGEKFNNFNNEETRGFFLPEALAGWIEDYKNFKNLNSFDMANSWENVEISDLLEGTNMHAIEDELITAGICEAIPGELEDCVDRYVAEHNIPVLHGIRLRGDASVEASSYRTIGDNNFNVIIYSDSYAAVTAVNTDDLDYIPYGFGVEPVDLTGSTPDSPAVLNMPLLDNRIYLASTEINDYKIESIEVLDKTISEDAVSVVKDEESGSFRINFNSNFFDDVVFKVTGSDGETYYLQIFRLTLAETMLEHSNDFNNHFTGVRAELIFDEETSWDDYELTATIIYADGSSVHLPLENLGWVDDNYGGNLQFGKEYSGEMSGKGLKRANFGYAFDDNDFDRDIRKVYFNVRFAGSTEERYAGTFSGSGRGTLLEVEPRYGEERE